MSRFVSDWRWVDSVWVSVCLGSHCGQLAVGSGSPRSGFGQLCLVSILFGSTSVPLIRLVLARCFICGRLFFFVALGCVTSCRCVALRSVSHLFLCIAFVSVVSVMCFRIALMTLRCIALDWSYVLVRRVLPRCSLLALLSPH